MQLKNSLLFKICVHVLVWLFLCIVPYLLSSGDAPEFTKMLRFSWVPMLFYAIVFYANYFVFIERLLFDKKIMQFILVNTLLIICCTWAVFEIKELINVFYPTPRPPQINGQPHKPSVKLFIYRDAISMLIPIIASIAFRVTEKWTLAEVEKREAEKEMLNSELQHLKYQLQPHFFFNSLNNIYALISRSPELAQDSVHKLAQLMRYMLYETDMGITLLNNEIEFMTSYIDLMKLRVSEKTIIYTDFPKQFTDKKIAPLLFISLIENAFKHGVSATQYSELYFSLTVNENTVTFITQNNNFPKTDKDKSGSGIGINNLQKRLNLLYKNNHIFESKVEDGIYKTILKIELE